MHTPASPPRPATQPAAFRQGCRPLGSAQSAESAGGVETAGQRMWRWHKAANVLSLLRDISSGRAAQRCSLRHSSPCVAVCVAWLCKLDWTCSGENPSSRRASVCGSWAAPSWWSGGCLPVGRVNSGPVGCDGSAGSAGWCGGVLRDWGFGRERKRKQETEPWRVERESPAPSPVSPGRTGSSTWTLPRPCQDPPRTHQPPHPRRAKIPDFQPPSPTSELTQAAKRAKEPSSIVLGSPNGFWRRRCK